MRQKLIWLASMLTFFFGTAIGQTNVWNPAGNASSTGNYNEAANWTVGIVPTSTSGKIVTNVSGAQVCRVTDNQATSQFVLGDGGDGGTLRIESGGTLTASASSWSGIGFNNVATVEVQAGGTLNFGSHCWIGMNSGANGTLTISGGTVNVSGAFGINHSNNGATGTVTVANSGNLNLDRLNTNEVNAGTINVAGGTITIDGDFTSNVNQLISDGIIVGYGQSGSGAVNVALSNNQTVITGITESIPPTIEKARPRDGAVQAVISRGVIIEFSELMNESTTESAITISPDVADKAFSWTGSSVTMTSASDMQANTAYTVTVGTTAADLAGNNLGTEFSFSFTTSNGTQTTVWAPGTDPANSAWEREASWSNGVADGDYKAVFNVTNAVEAVLSDDRYINKLVTGDGGPGGTLRVASGGHLQTGVTWSGIGYNNSSEIIIESGGSITFGQHMWVGMQTGAEGVIKINGGTLTVENQTGLGWDGGSGPFGTGKIIINSGSLVCKNFHPTLSINAGSQIDVRAGKAYITSGSTAADFTTNYVDNNKVVAYGGAGTLNVIKNGGTIEITASAPSTEWTGTWSNGTPSEDYDVLISSNYDGAGFQCKDLTIADGVSMNVASGTLDVMGDAVVTGSLSVVSGASLLTYSAGSFTGEVTVNRDTRYSDGRYSFVGTPVMQTSTINGASLGTYVYKYDETVNYSDNSGLDRWVDASQDELMPGVGYTQAFKHSLSFTGMPNNGEISVSGLSHTVAAASSANDRGWNLISNPYATAINVETFLSDNSSVINNAIYLWDDGGSDNGRRSNSDYLTANALGSVAGPNSGTFNGYIASGQAFFVQVTSENADASVVFKESQRVSGNNDAFFRQADETAKIKLALTGDYYNELLIGFAEEASTGFDKTFDAFKLAGNEHISFYSFMGANQMAILGLPQISHEEVQFELGYELKEAGVYELSVKEFENIPAGYSLFINYNGKEMNISAEHSVQLSLSAGEGRISASLRASGLLGTAPLDRLSVFDNNGLNIQGLGDANTASILIYDLMGKGVLKLEDIAIEEGRFSSPIHLEKGRVYILKAVTSDRTFTTRFIF